MSRQIVHSRVTFLYMNKLSLVSLLIMLAFGMSLSVAHAERGSGSSGSIGTSIGIDSGRHSGDDDGTPDQGSGDFNLDGTVQIMAGDDDGTADQGRGDFDSAGNPIDGSSNSSNSNDDDGTLDQGRGDFNADGSVQVTAGDDDGTPDQGRGDFFFGLFGGSDDSGSDDSDSSAEDDSDTRDVSVSISAWFKQVFSWWF